MKTDPKSGDIGIYTLNGLRMEVRLEGEFNRERSIIEVFGSYPGQ